ncbi:uncharacterized protein LOC125463976 isoform X3 [Stegostoma tigrinum]|uniref:uncharacterized protein LOC125463976 isoform X3 n=1 Tax=Stegostoma tigrinum TaxID=3053191 RepID=UPI00202B76DB|nr:uncharacterized protein LOC125463976 isoform X3 [Stegostoma tigrinum]
MVDWDWWVTLRDPRDIMAKHPTLILNEIVFYVLALLSLKHAARNGGRWKYLWLATIIHGLTTESVSYFVPGIDNFWHAQSSVMFLGIKLLWWTWHDTDPNIYDRHYCVPWTSYIFHMSFACCFVFLMELGRKTITGNVSKAISSGIVKEMAVALLAGIFTFPLAVLTQFVPLYHIPHDIYKIHTENIVMVQLAIYIFIVWNADRNGPRDEPSRIVSVSWLHHEAGQGILLNSLFFLLLVTMAKPEQQVSVGLHQTLGPCNVSEALTSVLGQTLYRHAYLCAGDYVEGTFDWHCLPGAEPPPDGTEWYPICGTPFYHHAEYIYTVSAFCLLGIAFYWTVLRRWAQPAKRVKYD